MLDALPDILLRLTMRRVLAGMGTALLLTAVLFQQLGHPGLLEWLVQLWTDKAARGARWALERLAGVLPETGVAPESP